MRCGRSTFFPNLASLFSLSFPQWVAGGAVDTGGRDGALHLPGLSPAVPRAAAERSALPRRKGRGRRLEDIDGEGSVPRPARGGAGAR